MKLLNNNKNLFSGKILFAVLVLGILIVSGCKAPETEEETTVTVSGGQTPTVREVSTGREAVATGPSLSSELKTLLAKAGTIDSLEYFYHEAEVGMRYYILGNNIRIQYTTRTKLGGNREYTTDVYIDLSARKARGYCEEPGCDEKRDVPVDLDIGLFNLETPIDVAKTIKTGEKKGEETISGKKTIVIETPLTNGNVQRSWIWDFKGIPIRYTIQTPEGQVLKRVDYEGLSINSVKMSDVTK